MIFASYPYVYACVYIHIGRQWQRQTWGAGGA